MTTAPIPLACSPISAALACSWFTPAGTRNFSASPLQAAIPSSRSGRCFGIDHCQAGAWLAAKWGLPEEVKRVAASHHNPPAPAAVDLEKLVQTGVLLTGVLGFDVSAPPHTMQEIRALLPHEAQYRFDPDPVTMKARIADRLDAFD